MYIYKYLSGKKGSFNCKGLCGIHGCTYIKVFKEELAYTIDKWPFGL